MPKVNIYNRDGAVVGSRELSAVVFGAKVNPTVVHEVFVGIMASRRHPYAHTKTRGDVSGGGKKPWKQKGTGRARQGSTRAPQWVHGGIVFGPRSNRNYDKKINTKQKRAAMLMALSDKVAHNHFLIVDDFGVKNGKTKETASMIKALPLTGKVTLVENKATDMLKRSVHNLPSTRLANLNDLNLLDILNSEFVVATTLAVDQLEQKYSFKAVATK